MGFELEKTEKEYWAKNFDLYLMQMKMKRKPSPSTYKSNLQYGWSSPFRYRTIQ